LKGYVTAYFLGGILIMNAESQRLEDTHRQNIPWKKWGPYLSERQWGTVREDYSADGTAWDFFSHDRARSRAYRWGEDGIAGISDNQQQLCFAIALWNENDPILKERLFGLTGSEGNHGEDVKEYYFYLDNTPTHSYMKYLYKYPHKAYPYDEIVAENKRRSRTEPEYELLNTGVFKETRYFDVQIEYAKASTDEILIQITVFNRGLEAKTLQILPTLWFRNTWSWDHNQQKPQIKTLSDHTIEATHPKLGSYYLSCKAPAGQSSVPLLFTENETNTKRVFDLDNTSPYVKDSFQRFVVEGDESAVNPAQVGTKAAAHYVLNIPAKGSQTISLNLSQSPNATFGDGFDAILQTRIQEADRFYADLLPAASDTQRAIQRQAFAGMLWSKQYYRYAVEEWLNGDPATIAPPPERTKGRNRHWKHLDAIDVLSMPDKWEYPWFAAWDLAFHAVPLALLDIEFAKAQLNVMTREWYMHPNGQLAAYEWAFGDVNPPVHAWATWRIYCIERDRTGKGDRIFLERVFQKLLLNFTWWVNRKDPEGNNVFEGGFLGLDNIGVFDRSAPLPTGGSLEQSDGTSWMAMYALNMLTISLELAMENPVYEDIATKFFEHFIYIADAMDRIGIDNDDLWDDTDGFFYDVLRFPDGTAQRLKVRSIVGLIPLFAVMMLKPDRLERLKGFKERLDWFLENRPKLVDDLGALRIPGVGGNRMLAIADPDRLRRILTKMLDETEFLSPHGIRALSRYHAENPFIFNVDRNSYRVDYEPAESSTGLFGGNSNWRGPIWMPVNYLLIESLQHFHDYLGDDFKVECPTGSGQWMTLAQVAKVLSQRLIGLFQPDALGKRPVYGDTEMFQTDPHWQNLILFYEYFHGDNGAGIGASHQTGWTGLVASLIQECAE
jgi:hypothetical protein